jgi:hypothetical protein
MEAKFVSTTTNTIEATVAAPAKGDLRIIFQQHGKAGEIMRSWPGGPPDGTAMGKVLKIYAEQDGKALPIEINYDKLIWSGLSWGAGEIKRKDFVSGRPITIRCSSAEKDRMQLDGELYEVAY